MGVAYPGASPGQVEREGVDRVEERLAALGGIDEMRALATDAFAQLTV